MTESILHHNDDIRINRIKQLLPPIALMERFPATSEISKVVFEARQAIQKILNNKDNRLLVIIGPCSIHDPVAAMEYAQRLVQLRHRYQDNLEIVMRVYFEKPRTTIGWKGLINDPYLDNSFKLNDGLRIGRKLLCDLNAIGMPAAGEFLDVISPQYVADLMCWGAIGARTTESQVHRELSSGLSCPIGFKNGTNGNVNIAIDAISSAGNKHHFLSVTKYGHSAIVETTGNSDCHIILRGGVTPNYDANSVRIVTEELEKAGLNKNIMIDFSHANSSRKFKNQLLVCNDVCEQMTSGNDTIFAVMIESHLVEGRQPLNEIENLLYGQSVTDACIGWQDTELLLSDLNNASELRRAAQS